MVNTFLLLLFSASKIPTTRYSSLSAGDNAGYDSGGTRNCSFGIGPLFVAMESPFKYSRRAPLEWSIGNYRTSLYIILIIYFRQRPVDLFIVC